MQRFILEQNIARFRRKLAEETDERARKSIQSLLNAAERSLSLLDAGVTGVRGAGGPMAFADVGPAADAMLSRFRKDFADQPRPAMLLDPGPGLHIIDVNDAYVAASGLDRDSLVGHELFVRFPDNPQDVAANGVNNLYASLKTAAETHRPHAMPMQRYDVEDENGLYVERYWRPVNTPLLDEHDRLIFLLHQVEEAIQEALPSGPGA